MSWVRMGVARQPAFPIIWHQENPKDSTKTCCGRDIPSGVTRVEEISSSEPRCYDCVNLTTPRSEA